MGELSVEVLLLTVHIYTTLQIPAKLLYIVYNILLCTMAGSCEQRFCAIRNTSHPCHAIPSLILYRRQLSSVTTYGAGLMAERQCPPIPRLYILHRTAKQNNGATFLEQAVLKEASDAEQCSQFLE